LDNKHQLRGYLLQEIWKLRAWKIQHNVSISGLWARVKPSMAIYWKKFGNLELGKFNTMFPFPVFGPE
jgi:hypothetical protein